MQLATRGSDSKLNMPTALVIAAHPDDGEFGCAGYAARLASQGWDVYFLVTTNGAKGTEDRAMPRERLIAQRVEVAVGTKGGGMVGTMTAFT